jgi:small subunit ribosomal protein S3
MFVRKFIKENLPLDIGYSHVKIYRKLNFLNLEVFVLKPFLLLGLNEGKFFSLKDSLSKALSTQFSSREISIKLIEVTDFDTDAVLLADFIRLDLEKRVPFRKVIKAALLKAQSKGVLGVRIQVAGRLNGAEIARTEWIKFGKMPLHTLRADIDYCYCTALLFSS